MDTTDLQDLEKGSPGPEMVDDEPVTPRSTSTSQSAPCIWTNISSWQFFSDLASMKRLIPLIFGPNDNVPPDEAANADELDYSVRRIHSAPTGYPKLATFLDSEDQFSIYRRFGYLASRLLLEKQDDLRQLESDLDIADEKGRRQCPHRLRTRQRFEGHKPTQQQLILEKIEEKFLEYCKILRNAREVAGFNKPTTREWKGVRTWLHNAQPLYPAEQDFADCKEDLITLRSGREHARLDGAVEWLIRSLRCPPITWLFQSKETKAKSNGENGERYVTQSRVEFAANMLLTLMILALLIIPIYLLFYLSNQESHTASNATDAGGDERKAPVLPSRFDKIDASCIGILLISTLAFSLTVTVFTSARRQEIIGASAAYCAILVVFISNLGNGSGVAA